MTTPTLSFVIPVRNDAARLKRCLQSIADGTSGAARIEIVVADNGSTDDSVAVARLAGAIVVEMPNVRLGELRNRGAAIATGEFLAFVDADHEIGPDWIPCAVSALADSEAGAIGAPYHAPASGTWVQRLYDRLRRHPKKQEKVAWLGSGNIAMRRAAFDAVGGFDVLLETCEDVDLCRKLRAHGYELLADSRMRCIHYGDPSTLGQVFSGELWRGRDNIRVSLRPPLVGRTLVSAAMPIANLAAFAMFVGGLLAAPSGLVISAVALAYLTLVIGARASVMARHARLADWPRACLVALAYEAGRALAVVGSFGYGRRRRAAA